MTATQDTQPAAPDVAAFVADVRARLADLAAEDRDELLDGLEADLAEQVRDSSTGVLSDPATYAAELRAAAGLPAGSGRRVQLPAVSVSTLTAGLREAGHRCAEVVGQHPVLTQAWSVVVALRPAWWVLRAWVAVTLLDRLTGPFERITLVPQFGVAAVGPALLVIAVVVSVLIGQDRIWPGSGPDRRTATRAVLLALNLVAIVAPISFPTGDTNRSTYYAGFDRGVQAGLGRAPKPVGLNLGGRPISNIFAYDSNGTYVQGVQLFDEHGDPLAAVPRQLVSGNGKDRTVGCPWFNGTTALYGVFPLQQRTQAKQGCVTTENTGAVGQISLPTPPLAQVPPVTLTPTQ